MIEDQDFQVAIDPSITRAREPMPSERATTIVIGDMRAMYGDPSPIAETARQLWSIWLLNDDTGAIRELTRADVHMMLALHKVAREKHRHIKDNLTDICGYVNLYEGELNRGR